VRSTPADSVPPNLGFNAHLVGDRNARAQLNTPALLVDLDTFERNLRAMQELAQKWGLRLRPHAKAHKSIEIARRQVAAGAIGLSCATLGEAEVLARAATDSGVPVVARGASAAAYKFMGDEHGGLVYANADDARLSVGDAVEFIVPHCDPTVNLFDLYHCMRGDVLVDIWPIDARGR